jgi:hypothetical protein
LKTLPGLLFLVLLSISPAQAETSLKRLIQGCSELTGIYKNQDEKRLLAAQMTSLSEALRGGYCRGVIDEYRRSEGYYDCRSVDWLQQAKYIAQHVTMPTDRLDVEDLLERSCGG